MLLKDVTQLIQVQTITHRSRVVPQEGFPSKSRIRTWMLAQKHAFKIEGAPAVEEGDPPSHSALLRLPFNAPDCSRARTRFGEYEPTQLDAIDTFK